VSFLWILGELDAGREAIDAGVDSWFLIERSSKGGKGRFSCIFLVGGNFGLLSVLEGYGFLDGQGGRRGFFGTSYFF